MTLQKTNRTSIMASFATLKSLSDAKKYQSPYQLLSKFINYIILSDSLYSFSAVEMKNRLNSHFCFSIPEAVVKTALKNVPGAILADGIYTISKTEVCTDELFEETKKESDEYESCIIQLLSEYVCSRGKGEHPRYQPQRPLCWYRGCDNCQPQRYDPQLFPCK